MAGLLGGALAGLGSGMEHAASQYGTELAREQMLKREDALRLAEMMGREEAQGQRTQAQIDSASKRTDKEIAARHTDTQNRLDAEDRRLKQQDEEFQQRYGQENRRLDAELKRLNRSGGSAKAQELQANIDYMVKSGIAKTPAEAFKMLHPAKGSGAKDTLDAHLRTATQAYRATLGNTQVGSQEGEEKFVRNYLKTYYNEDLPGAAAARPAPSTKAGWDPKTGNVFGHDGNVIGHATDSATAHQLILQSQQNTQ